TPVSAVGVGCPAGPRSHPTPGWRLPATVPPCADCPDPRVSDPVFTRVALAGAIATLGALAVPLATPVGSQTSSYVALGDSYTAGPLIPEQLPDPMGCFRSDHNYPHLVAAALRVSAF